MTFDHFDTHPQLEDTMHTPSSDNWECHFAPLDDGTLDTVFVCSHCGKEVRTNPEPPSDPNEPFDRIEEGGLIALEHLDDCPSGPNESTDDDDIDDEDEDEPDACCPMCGGPGVPLGALGHLFHWRCRNCGAQFSAGD